MINNYKTIIWDFNGTILNDVELCVSISNRILKDRGLKELDQESYKNVFGFPITAYYEKIGVDLTKVSMASLTEQFINLYMESIKKCKLQDGIENMMEELEQAQKNQYVLTAAHTDMALELLGHFDVLKYFKVVAGLDNHRAESKVGVGKKLLEKNGIAVAEAVLIGDTLHDFEVAEALGIDCVLVAQGHQSRERLERGVKGRAVVVGDISEVGKL